MSKDLGSFKKSRSAADSSMLTETHRKATEALTYSQRTVANKPVFYYNFGSLIAGPPALFTIGRITTPVSGSSPPVDTTPTYAIAETATSVDEGDAVTFTVTTTNVPDGTTLYWTTDGTAVAADFTDDADSGSFTVTSGSGSIVRTVKSDLSTEGSETFTLSVRIDSISGDVVATSGTITINDTSISVQYTWTEQSSAPSQPYARIDVTSDFTTQIATRQSSITGAQGPYISTDSGATWTRKINGITLLTSGASYTVDVAVASGNGTIMYAAQRREFVSTLASTYDKIYKSTDTADNWTAISPADSTWQSITCSSDGQVILAGNSNSGNASYDRKMAYSTNGGSTWSIASPTGQWTSVAMSSDGTRMYGVATGVSNLQRSSDTGATWTTTAAGAAINSVACSSNGLIVLITRGSSAPMVSTNGGVNLTAITGVPSIFWARGAVSDDGTTMVVVSNNTAQRVYISVDSGTTWVEQTGSPSTTWSSAAINSDGSKIIVGPSGNAKPYVGIPPV